MHISRGYNASLKPGKLTLAPIEASAGNPQNERFIKEINESGVYIHKLNQCPTALKDQLDKIEENKLPTPATFVGVGIHRTYNLTYWAETSGLVFGPDTVSLISYKGDINSVRLASLAKSHHDFKHDPRHSYRNYSNYLSGEFNQLGLTASAFNNRTPKRLQLIADIKAAKEKYRELEIRSNLAFMSSDRNLDNSFSHTDESSKYSIAKSIREIKKPVDGWTKNSLLKHLGGLSRANALHKDRLRHAIRKINRFNSDDEIRHYLKRGTVPPTKKNHYIDIMKQWGAQTPNEHLVMPTLANVLGICVNIESVKGFDQAIEINTALRERGQQVQYPALVYVISNKEKKSLMQVGWSKCVIPWTSEGLIEFAKTGSVIGIDDKKFVPDHFDLLNKISDSSSVIMFDDKSVRENCTFQKNFIDDLSKVRSGKDNLLHFAITYGRSLDVVKFFYYWNVDAFIEKGTLGRTAMQLAKEKNHPCASFLSYAASPLCTAEKTIKERNDYIYHRINKANTGHRKQEKNYTLRNCDNENGEIDFIPELGAHRVMNGEFTLHKGTWTGAPAHVKGLRRYNAEKKELELTVIPIFNYKIGLRHIGGSGIFHIENSDDKFKKMPSIYFDAEPMAKQSQDAMLVLKKFYCFGKLKNLETMSAILFTAESNRFITCEICGGSPVNETDDSVNVDVNACTYYCAPVFIAKPTVGQLQNALAEGKFSHLSLNEKNFDRNLSTITRATTICKYAVAQIKYLRGWQQCINLLNEEEKNYLEKNGENFIQKTYQLIVEQHQMLHQAMSQYYKSYMVIEFEKIDDKGACFLQHVADEYNLLKEKNTPRYNASLQNDCNCEQVAHK